MGTAFVGVADDPSAVLHNPAGITQLSGTQAYSGFSVLSVQSDYSSGLGSEETKDRFFFPPHLYMTGNLGANNLMFGLGIYAPFGIGGREWDDDGLTRYSSVNNFIATFSINPTVAWKVTPQFSIAAGVDYLYAVMRSEQMVDQSMVAAADGRTKIDADGDGWGYNVGLLYKPSDRWQLGAAFRSRIKTDFTGDMRLSGIASPLQPLFGGASYKTGVSTTSTFPEVYSIGVAFRPSDRLLLATDFEYVRWSSFDQVQMHIANPVPAAGLTDATTVLNWHNNRQVKVGGEYRVNDAWLARAGYAFIEGAIPEESLSPGYPDTDQHNFSIGAGWQRGKLTLDTFYMIGLSKAHYGDNTQISGRYDTTTHYFGISGGYRF
jgi:long-chain fatty acid transport protein